MQNVQPLLDQFVELSGKYVKELEAVVKGNKTAGARARKLDVQSIRPLMKQIKNMTLGNE
jgi:hypothetical protein